MFISDFAIKRPIITVVTMIALVTFGLASLTRLDTDEFPDLDQPIVFVGIAYPGASPDVVEREVVTRLEEKISGISGLDKINSTSTDGFAQIVVQFVFSKDVNQATQDIRDAISGVRAQLPAEILEPVVQRFDPNTLPIVSLAITSTSMSSTELSQLADQTVASDLRGVEGVAQVNVLGGDSAQLNVDVRPADLAASGIGIDQVVNSLRAQNLAAPVGNVTDELEQRSIRLQGRFENPSDFESMVVSSRNGQLIRLGQVASVSPGSAEPTSAARFNGMAAIGLDVVKSREYATTAVSNGVQARIAQLTKTLPPGTKIETVRDAGVRVHNSVRNVEETLIEGAILTVLVVFLFLNSWRSTVITGLALPVSVLTSFAPLLAFGFTLNVMSLMGLSLAIGILIDDAIVVRENIVRHIEKGADHVRAAHEGTNEIGVAVTATTFAIVAVFVPVGFMPGIAGQFFKPFALTIAAAVLVSLFVSFSLDPMLSAFWPDPQLEAHDRRNPVARALVRFNAWFDRQADRYTTAIGWALDHRALTLGIAGASLVAAIALQILFGGFGFAPLSDNSELNIAVETPPASTVAYTTIKTEEVAAIARSHPEVAYTYTTVGSSSGSGAVDNGTVYVHLVPKTRRNISQDAFGQLLRKEVTRVAPGARHTFLPPGEICWWKSEGPSASASRPRRERARAARRADRRFRARDSRGGGRRSFHTRTETRIQRPGQPRARRIAGSQPESARYRASLRVRRRRCRNMDRPERHIALRSRPARKRRSAQRERSRPAPGDAHANSRIDRLHSVHPAEPGRDNYSEHGSRANRSLSAATRRDDRRQRARRIGRQREPGRDEPRQESAAAAGLSHHFRRPGRKPESGFRKHDPRPGCRGDAHVSDSRHSVRIVPRSARDSRLASIVAHRCRRRASRDARYTQHHESHRRDDVDGYRREERDSVDRLCEVGARARSRSA